MATFHSSRLRVTRVGKSRRVDMEKPGRQLPVTISARLTLSGRRQHGSETTTLGLLLHT